MEKKQIKTPPPPPPPPPLLLTQGLDLHSRDMCSWQIQNFIRTVNTRMLWLVGF